jgi:hypothetical protein
MKPIESAYLPNIGYIVDDNAAMFLCTTNSKICFVEFFISSPKTTKEQRKKYTEVLLNQLTEDAKELNYKKMVNYIDNPSVINNFKIFGFNEYLPKNKITCLVRDI